MKECCSPIFGLGVDSADAILKSVYGVDVRKALNPLDPHDYEKIVKHFENELKGQAQPIEAGAYKKAIEALDVDWTKMSAEQRHKVLDAAKAHLEPLKTIAPKIQQSFETNAKEIYASSKSKAVLKYDLDIESSLSMKDEKAIDFISKTQAHYVRNAAGERVEKFDQAARAAVRHGLDRGLGSADIAHNLSYLGSNLQRTDGYWNMVAMVFLNRARTASQLQSFGEAGIMVYTWESVMDQATSVQCRFMHGRKFPVKLGLDAMQACEDADDPEAVESIMPFMSLARVEGGSKGLFIGRGGEGAAATGNAQRAAYVEHNAVGIKDHPGSYSGAMSTQELAAAGVTAPPLHGRCRSTVIPSFEPGGVPTKPAAVGFHDVPQTAPLFEPEATKPASADVKEQALSQLAELPPSGWGDDTVKAPLPHVMGTPFEDYNHAQMTAMFEKFGQQTKKPKIADVSVPVSWIDPKITASLIKSPKKLAFSTKQLKVVKAGGDYYLFDGEAEALTAHKLMGKTQVQLTMLDLDKVPKSELPHPANAAPLEHAPPPHNVPGAHATETAAPAHPVPGVTPIAAPALPQGDASNILATKIGDAKGSNEGGIYRGKDGIERYVKFYKDQSQAAGEHLANRMYLDLGHGAAESEIFEHGGSVAYSSRMLSGVKTLEQAGLDEVKAKKFMKGFVADVLTGNWDAAGMRLDNAGVMPNGDIIRLDNGGTFLMRAKAGRKSTSVLNEISEWDKLFDSGTNPAYSKIAKAAGYNGPEDFKHEVVAQIKAITSLRDSHGGWDAYVTKTSPLLKGADRNAVVKMLDERSKLLEEKMKELTAPVREHVAGEPYTFGFASKEGKRLQAKIASMAGMGREQIDAAYTKVYSSTGVSRSDQETVQTSVARWTSGGRKSPEQLSLYKVAGKVIAGKGKGGDDETKTKAYESATKTRSSRWREALDHFGFKDVPTPTHFEANRGVSGLEWALDVARAWADPEATHVTFRCDAVASWGLDLSNGKRFAQNNGPTGAVMRWDVPIEKTLVDQFVDDGSFLKTYTHEHEIIAGEGHDKGIRLPKDGPHIVIYQGDHYTYKDREKLIERMKKDGHKL